MQQTTPDGDPGGSPSPVVPKVGTVQRAVLNLLSYHEAFCRREFAQHDIYEVSARIGELRRLGWHIGSRPCKRHEHQSRNGLIEYFLQPIDHKWYVAHPEPGDLGLGSSGTMVEAYR